MNKNINIKLNPITDGYQGKLENVRSTTGYFLVVGTNFEHKVISDKEYCEYASQMSGYANQKIIDNYLITFDDRQTIEVDGCFYFIGSFLVMKLRERPEHEAIMEIFDPEAIEQFKEDIAGHFAELIIDGEPVEALVCGTPF